jgi:hypothetical protein
MTKAKLTLKKYDYMIGGMYQRPEGQFFACEDVEPLLFAFDAEVKRLELSGAGMKVRAEELAKRDAEIERLRAALENLLAHISEPSWKDSRLDYENRQITNGAVDAAWLALKAAQTPKAKGLE